MDQERKAEGMGNMEMCPMASVCKGMLEKPRIGLVLMIPGFLLVLGGVLILLEPTILVWLMAGASILIGLMMLFFSIFIRKMSVGFQRGGRQRFGAL